MPLRRIGYVGDVHAEDERRLGRTLFGFLLCSLAACGGSAPPTENPTNAPVVVVSAGPKEQPVEMASDGPGEEPPSASGDVEPADACIEKLRARRDSKAMKAQAEDAVLYAEALRAERAGEMDKARRGYLQVVMKYPQSSFVPLAYFAFGEMFFRESEKDPSRLELAQQSYMEVVKYPPAENVALGAAHFRLAEVFRKKGDLQRALSEEKKVLELHTNQPKAECSASLAEPARGMLVTTYVEVGRPEVAYEFFRRSSGDPPGESTHALSMIAALAELYFEKNGAEHAITALLGASADRYGQGFCRREALLVAKLEGMARGRGLSQEHARRCDPH